MTNPLIGTLFWLVVGIIGWVTGLLWVSAIAVMGLIFGLFMRRGPDPVSGGVAPSDSQRRSLSDETCAENDCAERWTVDIEFVNGERYRGCERHAQTVILMATASRGSELEIPEITKVTKRI